MARKRGGLAGIYDRNKKFINPVYNAAQFVSGGPAGLYNSRLLTQEGGGLKKTVNDPLYQAQLVTLAGGLAAPALSGGAAAGGTAAGGGAAGGGDPGGGGKLAGLFTGLGKVFGKKGIINQNLPLIQGIGTGIMGTREGARADEQARLTREEDARQFNEAQALRARQQANADQDAMMAKQQFDELNANRAKLRALLTGGM